VIAGPDDVVTFDGVSYGIELDGISRGIPRGVAIDALTTVGADLLVSFDTSVTIGGLHVDDLDLVRVTASAMSIFAYVSGTGVPHVLDLDGVHRLGNGNLLLSFDGSATAKGIAFDDDDIIEYDPFNETFELVYDGVARHAAWAAADLDAVGADEPFTPTPTSTPSSTPESTETPTRSPTPTHSDTPTSVPTAVPSSTPTPLPTDTEPPTRTLVPTSTATPPPTSTPSPTATPSSTGTVSPTRTPTGTPSRTATATLTTTPPAGFTAGDANCDGVVSAADIPALIELTGQAISACGADADCDGVTGADDVSALQSRLFNDAVVCDA
jgi:hypothetical protein